MLEALSRPSATNPCMKARISTGRIEVSLRASLWAGRLEQIQNVGVCLLPQEAFQRAVDPIPIQHLID